MISSSLKLIKYLLYKFICIFMFYVFFYINSYASMQTDADNLLQKYLFYSESVLHTPAFNLLNNSPFNNNFDKNVLFANTYKHNDPRLIFYSENYPWRTIGLLKRNINSFDSCTASLVGPKLILTNRHCITGSSSNRVLEEQFIFYYNLSGDVYNSSSVVAYPVRWGDSSDYDDWAILELEAPIGNILGYLGVKSMVNEDSSFDGFVGATTQDLKDWESDICLEEKSPFELIKKRKQEEKYNDDWMIDYQVTEDFLPKVCLAGFPGDLGGFHFSLSPECSLLGESIGLTLLHDCASTRGTSGSPIFYREINKGSNNEHALIVALNRGEGRPENKSLLNVYFNGFNANSAVFTDKFLNALNYLRSQEHGKLYFKFKYLKKIDDVSAETAYLNNYYSFSRSKINEIESYTNCSAELINSLNTNNIVGEDFLLDDDIIDLLSSYTLYSHPSRNRKINGHLTVRESYSSVFLDLNHPYDITANKFSRVLSDSEGLNKCSITKQDIIDFLEYAEEESDKR